MSEPLGVGIIGCGQAAQALHLPALASLPGQFVVRHLVDAAPSVAEGLAARLGAVGGTDPQALLADPAVDVVLVAAPDTHHAPLAVAACRAGVRAVLVEKPLALTAGEAEAVAHASREHGVPVQVGTMHRYDPGFALAREQLPDRPDAVLIDCLIGPNEAFRSDTSQVLTGPVGQADAEVALAYLGAALHHAGAGADKDFLTTTVMALTLSIHDLAPLRTLLGEPSSVLHATPLPGSGWQAALDYDGTRVVLTAYESAIRRTEWRWRWLSRERTVELSFPQTWDLAGASTVAVHTAGPDGATLRTETFSAGHQTGYRSQWRHLYDVATEGVTPLTPAADAAADVALVERIIATGSGRPALAPDATGVALLGAGWITAVHGPVLASLPDTRVAAVLSRTEARAERRSWAHRCPAGTFADLRATLASTEVDVALVAGPPAVHAEHTLAALEAGCHAIVEKPFTATLAEADAVVAAAGRPGSGYVAYAENYAFMPQLDEARCLLEDGAVGRSEDLWVWCLHGRPGWGSFLEPGWGGGCLFDLGPHPLWWALTLGGWPAVPVTAVAASLSGRRGEGDDEADVQLFTTEGVLARVSVSWTNPGGERTGARVAGTDGVLEVDVDPKPALRLTRAGATERLTWPAPERRTVGTWVARYGYLQQIECFVEAFRSGRPPRPGAEEGRAVLEMICAAYASAGQGGEPVPLPFTGPRDRTPYQLWRSA